jgi:cellulose biosynthesis protein BcsQ
MSQPTPRREATAVAFDESPHPRLGSVLCFVSAKGGSGKTILAATTASLLMKADQRVVAIDTDFSTRGLSLYLLDTLTSARDPGLHPENCLADALLHGVPAERVTPLIVPQRKGEFNIILPNSDFRRGGAPEDQLLRLGGDQADGLDFERRYFELLRAVCDRLRRTYDYIVIDTRGGYDYSSKVPAVLADGYVIVIEADPISVQQVLGLKTRIDQFAEEREIRSNHQGFIVNKALFAPKEGKGFGEALAGLYGGQIFGIVPADRNAISAYQTRDLPYQKHASSDFAYYGLLAIEQYIDANAPLNTAREGLLRLKSGITASWRAAQLLHILDRMYPLLVLGLLVLALVAFLLYSRGSLLVTSQVLLGVLATLVVCASVMPLVGTIVQSRHRGFGRRRQWIVSGAVAAVCLALFAYSFPAVQSALSTNVLLQQAELLRSSLTLAREEIVVANRALSDQRSRVAVLALERTELERDLKASQQRLSELDATRARLELALAAEKAQRTREDSTWRAHIDWCLNDTGPLECQREFLQFAPFGTCRSGGGRQCFMQVAVDAARRGDDRMAYSTAVACQCHNAQAAQSIRIAGPKAVSDYLRTLARVAR